LFCFSLLQEHSAVIEANETRIFRASELESSVSTQATAALQQHLGKEGGKNNNKKTRRCVKLVTAVVSVVRYHPITIVCGVWRVCAELEHVRGSFLILIFPSFFYFLFLFQALHTYAAQIFCGSCAFWRHTLRMTPSMLSVPRC
jgi:hypothetical protein